MGKNTGPRIPTVDVGQQRWPAVAQARSGIRIGAGGSGGGGDRNVDVGGRSGLGGVTLSYPFLSIFIHSCYRESILGR